MTAYFAVTQPASFPPDGRRLQTPAKLAWALAAATGAASALTLFVPSLLTGVPAMNGSARGTAAMMLLVAVPLLARGITMARRDSALGEVIWLGATAYVLYNAVLFCFATPFNPAFLLYVAMLSLSLWSLVALGMSIRPPSRPARDLSWVAWYIWAIVVLNTLAWLSQIAPAMFADRPSSFLDEFGLITNPVHVQDLAFWLPAMGVAATLMLRSHAWGLTAAAAGLVFWQLEALGVAVDQWFGHRADPSSDVATVGAVWLFLALFAAGVLPTLTVLRRLRS